jgi:hypothetical protein
MWSHGDTFNVVQHAGNLPEVGDFGFRLVIGWVGGTPTRQPPGRRRYGFASRQIVTSRKSTAGL